VVDCGDFVQYAMRGDLVCFNSCKFSFFSLGAHSAPCRVCTGFLFRESSGRGVTWTTHSHLASRLKKM